MFTIRKKIDLAQYLILWWRNRENVCKIYFMTTGAYSHCLFSISKQSPVKPFLCIFKVIFLNSSGNIPGLSLNTMACGFWLNFMLFCYLVSLKNIWDFKFLLTVWNIPLLCSSPLAQNRSTHCNSREREKSQDGLGISFRVYISLEGSKMVRGTGDLSNLTLGILKYYVRIENLYEFTRV